MKQDIRSMTEEELKEAMAQMGEKPFRASQIYGWLHKKGAASFSEMTNLSQDLRKRLSDFFALEELTRERVQISKEDRTRKYLFRLSDGNFIESVLMYYHYGASVCISSQVGCNMGCRFCASTIGGKIRDLSAGEMLDQIYEIAKEIPERISHVVVMGTGEPLDNYDNLVRFIRMISDPHGMGLSQRNITVSTCGIIPNMRKLAGEKLQITLALSLHASSQEEREKLLPVARKYPLNEVLTACDEYFDTTRRRITYEYALVNGVNSSSEDAKKLIRLLGNKNCHMNLIPVNPIKERSYHSPGQKAAEAFKELLLRGGINATIRRSMGRDIDGACGQLRRRQEEGVIR